MRIIGIDCGKKSGYAVIDVERDAVKIVELGILPLAGEARRGLVCGARKWLEFAKQAYPDAAIVLSQIIQVPRIPTDHAAIEVQGVCRLFADAAYYPATIHSRLGTHDKAQTRKLVEKIVGYEIKTEQHSIDAAAVAICYAVEAGVFALTTLPMPKPEKRRSRGVPDLGPDEDITPDRIVELMRAGKARVKR